METGVIISNPENLEKKKKDIIKDGLEKFHVVSDFDRTLTKAFVNGKKIPSVISILRDYNYLDEEYSKRAKALFNKYHTIEIDPEIPKQDKKQKMHEWWSKHFELLISSGLNKQNLERIVSEDIIKFREGVPDFLKILNEKNIPLVILSSSGVGEVIKMLLNKKRLLYDNIFIVTNEFIWDDKGCAVSVKKPIIHSMNKSEVSVKNKSFYTKIKDRKNVLVLGDSLSDSGMIKGFDYKTSASVGFLNYNVKENLESYKSVFDVVITNDGNFKWVNDFLRELNNYK